MKPKPIAITCGDPAGVGPEVIAAFLRQNPGAAANSVVIGPPSWLRSLEGVSKKAVGDAGYVAVPGQPSIEGACHALYALDEAAYGCRQGRYRAVVTGPVSKTWMARAGWQYAGQTEFFGDRWHGEPTMGFVGEQLKVVLATWHIPLAEVPAACTEAVLERAVERAHWLGKRLGVSEPRLGVCGLNPHAGEDGQLGHEEQGILDPALDIMRPRFPHLSCCLPGDTVFRRQLRGEFDVTVALYHDQGLAPLKTLEFDEAVNITLGLPFVRTSPDHGTGFDIAGQDRAQHSSFSRAWELADRLSR